MQASHSLPGKDTRPTGGSLEASPETSADSSVVDSSDSDALSEDDGDSRSSDALAPGCACIADAAGDLTQLPPLYRHHREAIAGKHPVSTGDLDRAEVPPLQSRRVKRKDESGEPETPAG